jgi:hypothetical protein
VTSRGLVPATAYNRRDASHPHLTLIRPVISIAAPVWNIKYPLAAMPLTAITTLIRRSTYV